MKITFDNKEIETKFNIGDKVYIDLGYVKDGSRLETSLYYTDELTEDGFNKTEERPTEYTVESISVVINETGVQDVKYNISYENKRNMFPSGYRVGIEAENLVSVK